MSTRSTSDDDASRDIGREDLGGNRKSDEVRGKALYISFGTSPPRDFQVDLADCIPCEVAKSTQSNNNDNADPVPRKKERLKLQDCFGDWGSPPIEANFVSALDVGSKESLIPRSFRFGNYPDLTEFLLGNKDDFFQQSANYRTNKAHEYNNYLTVRLIQFADIKGYQFQCLHDDGIFGDDLPTAVEQLPSFKRIRDKIRNVFQRLKRKEEKSGPSPSIHIGSDPVPAGGTKNVEKQDNASTGTDRSSPETQENDSNGDKDDAMDLEAPNGVADDSIVHQTFDTQATEVAARIIPRSWKWNQYRCFREFLTRNRYDFVHHNTRHAGTPKQTSYNNEITKELLAVARQNDYRFQCMDDCDEGDTGMISTKTGFAFVHHRIRMYYRNHVEDENRRIAASAASSPGHGSSEVTTKPSSVGGKVSGALLSPADIEIELSSEGKAALRALFQTFIRRGTVDTMQLAKAVKATGYTDAFILESARRARQRLFSNSTK